MKIKSVIFSLILIIGTHAFSQKNPLVKAILNNNPKKVSTLIKKKKYLVNQKNSLNWTPLIYAIDAGNDTIVQILVEQGGADVNTKINTGETPLHIAAKKGLTKIATYLVNHGAKLEEQDLIRQTPLILAVRSNQYETAKALLELGANPNHPTSSYRTALDWAKDSIMIELLKKYNAKKYKKLY
jgi:ankyrin repeat protein